MTSPLPNQLREAAAGSREMDGAIRAQFFGDFFYCDYETGTSCGDAPNCSKDGCYKPLGIMDERTSLPRDWRDDDRLPAYTTSIDAALSLANELLPEWNWKVKQDSGTSIAAVFKPLRHRETVQYGAHKSPAIALCLALLKAREGSDAD